MIKVSVIQQQCSANRTDNLDRSIAGIQNAARNNADLVLLPELHATPYFCVTQNREYFKLAETIPGPTCDVLSKTARTHNLVIVGSVFENRAPGVYHNTSVVFERDGSIAGIYRKMHIPDDPGYNEKYYFTPGDLGFTPIKTSVATLGVLICWDQWFPEAARLMALNGAEILLFPTAIGWSQHERETAGKKQLDAWLTIQRAHAIANCLPLLCCNRVGQETTDGDFFWGNSFICGQQGEILASCSSESTDQAEIIHAEIDISASEQLRQDWPFLRDRRVDAYTDLQKRYKG